MTTRLDLPLPDSPNREPKHHHMENARWVNRQKRAAWFAACGQELPTTDPPAVVEITALFRVERLRDEVDNLPASLKRTLDALKRPGPKDPATWRQGIHERKGYFVDDDPEHCRRGIIAQKLAPRGETGLTLWIKPLDVQIGDGRS
jgi:hypothetical protein